MSVCEIGYFLRDTFSTSRRNVEERNMLFVFFAFIIIIIISIFLFFASYLATFSTVRRSVEERKMSIFFIWYTSIFLKTCLQVVNLV